MRSTRPVRWEEVADATREILDAIDRGIEIDGGEHGLADWLGLASSCRVNFDHGR